MDPWKRRLLLETIISRFHVNFWGCIAINLSFRSTLHPGFQWPPGLWTIFRLGNPNLNLHLWLESWVGGRSNHYSQLMVNCWFGVFGGLDSWNPRKWTGLATLGPVPRFESQTTNRNQQLINHYLIIRVARLNPFQPSLHFSLCGRWCFLPGFSKGAGKASEISQQRPSTWDVTKNWEGKNLTYLDVPGS